MLAVGMLEARAFISSVRKVRFVTGSLPFARTEIIISLATLLKILPRLASLACFLCLIFAHALCPLILHLLC